VAEAVQRVERLIHQIYHRHGSVLRLPVALRPGYTRVGSKAFHQLSQQIAQKAIKVFPDARLSLPLSSHTPLTAIYIAPSTEEPPAFITTLRQYFPKLTVHLLPQEASDEVLRTIIQRLPDHEPVVITPVVKPAAWQHFGLSGTIEAFIQYLTEQYPVILAVPGSPHILELFPEAALRICAFSDVPVSQEALARFLATGP